MTPDVIMWLVGGAILALLMMLFVVILSRGIEQRRARDSIAAAVDTSIKTSAKGGDAKTAAAAALLTAINPGLGVIARAAAARRAGIDNIPPRKRVAAGVGIAISLAAVGIFTAIMKGIDDGPREPPVPTEITAGELHGTLLSAGSRKPVVLIVPGSGPTDRDGNNPLGVKASSYRLLAEALAAKGISSVRVDKRGMFGSAAAGDPNAVTVEKYAEDYRAWIDAIREKTGRKCVWLLGHSEGALMVSTAAEGRKDVCGLILVAGSGRKLGDVLREQLHANPANAPLLGQAEAAIADLEAGRHTDTTNMHPALVPLFAPQVQDFLISEMSTDPVEAVRRAGKKTLIVQGTADLQITVEDARLLDKAPRTTLRTITGMNHVLKDAPGDRAANLATYSNPDLPLAPRLASVIEDFIEDDD